MDYAKRLEQTNPSHAQTLKAELHKRAMELSLNDVKDKAAMVHEGTTQTHQNVLKIKEMVAQLASQVNNTAKTSKASTAHSGALQTSVANAEAKTAAAGEHGVSLASSSGEMCEQHQHMANDVQKRTMKWRSWASNISTWPTRFKKGPRKGHHGRADQHLGRPFEGLKG